MSKINDYLNEVSSLMVASQNGGSHNYWLVVTAGKLELVRKKNLTDKMVPVLFLTHYDIDRGLLSPRWNQLTEVLDQLIKEGKL